VRGFAPVETKALARRGRMSCRFCGGILCPDLRVAEIEVITCKGGARKTKAFPAYVHPRSPTACDRGHPRYGLEMRRGSVSPSAAPTGLDGYLCRAFPTLKRGANFQCAYGAVRAGWTNIMVVAGIRVESLIACSGRRIGIGKSRRPTAQNQHFEAPAWLDCPAITN
jgi:hypothetical protein